MAIASVREEERTQILAVMHCAALTSANNILRLLRGACFLWETPTSCQCSERQAESSDSGE